MMEKMPYIIVDLDGTLCNCHRRVHLAQSKLWDEFHSLCGEDEVNSDVKWLISAIADVVRVVIITGRPEKFRPQTLKWLIKNEIPADCLYMRPDDDYSSDKDLKIKIWHKFIKDHPSSYVMFALDDRDQSIDGWRAMGVPCYQVRPSSY